jgi:hypothetical protein
LILLVGFCLRRRRKRAFDGNFDPAHVRGGGSGTLPKIDLGEDGLMGNNGVEDDGMGGRLGAGPGRGGIIAPYPIQLAAVIGTAGNSQRNLKGVAVGAAKEVGRSESKKKRALGQQYFQRTPNQPTSSGFSYPSSFHPKRQLTPNSVSPASYSVLTSDESPSFGGSGSGGVYYQSMGRGPSPRLSVLALLSGGKNANEMEAMPNPYDVHEQLPTFQQACMQTGFGPHPSARSDVFISDHVVVYEDGGRLALRKGEEAGGKGESRYY